MTVRNPPEIVHGLCKGLREGQPSAELPSRQRQPKWIIFSRLSSCFMGHDKDGKEVDSRGKENMQSPSGGQAWGWLLSTRLDSQAA